MPHRLARIRPPAGCAGHRSEVAGPGPGVGGGQGGSDRPTRGLVDGAGTCRKGKAPGGYQYTLEDVRVPFVFANAVGVHQDVQTLLHEGGHAFHCLAARNEELVFLRSAPMEFCEVASMSMELLGAEHFDVFYNKDDANRARRTLIEGVIRILPWIATIDSFQHWLYTHPRHDREHRTEQWRQLMLDDKIRGQKVRADQQHGCLCRVNLRSNVLPPFSARPYLSVIPQLHDSLSLQRLQVNAQALEPLTVSVAVTYEHLIAFRCFRLAGDAHPLARRRLRQKERQLRIVND